MTTNDFRVAPLGQKFRDKNAYNISSHTSAVLSGNIVGAVVTNGPNASFPTGAHVFSQTMFNHPTAGGGLQEYTLISSLYSAIVPSRVSDTETALYPINALTSAMALFSTAGFGWPFPGTPESRNFDYASQKVVIIDGGNNTGKLAIQFVKVAAVRTIITIASLSGAEGLKIYSATHVIARQAPNIEDKVRQIVRRRSALCV